jgi:hypothetical protein
MCESRDCVVVGIDDTIQEKPYSQENELVCWHYDHTKGKTVKGVHFLSAVLTTDDLATPIGVEFVRKPVRVVDEQGRLSRRSKVTKNEDGSEGVRYLVASDLTLTAGQMIGIYQKRWKTEEYHKSIKQCSSLGDSPAHTPVTQQTHCIAAIISYVKLEKLKLKNRSTHFALKSQIWVEATRHALNSMSKLSTRPNKYAALLG